MRVIYISNEGSDENNGDTQNVAVRSWRRASSLSEPDAEFRLIGLETVRRVMSEFEHENRKAIYSKTEWG